MKAAFVEFADGEMKVPHHILSNLSIQRIFTPKNPNTNRLYVEFADQITADLIWSFSVNLLPGRRVKLWIPPQFYERFKAIDFHAFNLRTGSEKFKTSIKFGNSDFAYMRKPLFGGPWVDVPMDSFPPIDFSIGSTSSSSSPPRGRQRQESLKRPRSLESDELDPRKSSKTSPVEYPPNAGNNEHETSNQDNPDLQKAAASTSEPDPPISSKLAQLATENCLN